MGEVEGQLVLTRCAVEVPVAKALSHVHAVVAPVDLHVILWTHTGVVPQCVVAGARTADYRIHHTLVNVFTDATVYVEVVARRTVTREAAKRVDTVSSLTQARQLQTLIYVF